MSLSQAELMNELAAQCDFLDPDDGDRIEFEIEGEGMALILTDVRSDYVDGNDIVKVTLAYATADQSENP